MLLSFFVCLQKINQQKIEKIEKRKIEKSCEQQTKSNEQQAEN